MVSGSSRLEASEIARDNVIEFDDIPFLKDRIFDHSQNVHPEVALAFAPVTVANLIAEIADRPEDYRCNSLEYYVQTHNRDSISSFVGCSSMRGRVSLWQINQGWRPA